MLKNLFITGNPGCGKTTLIKEIFSLYPKKLGGFYTEEIIENNSRAGFLLKTFEGDSQIFAHKKIQSPYKLKKYKVDLDCLELLGLSAMEKAVESGKIVVIDEIGSMEVLSEKFRKRIYELLLSPSKVIATIRLKSKPFTDEIKNLPDSRTFVLTRNNYHQIKTKIIEWLKLVCSM